MLTALVSPLGPSALWYVTRATGTVTLILLTVGLVLGIANVGRLASAGWPRFVVERVHRNISLLALALLLVHIATSVLDSFAGIQVLDAVIPFTGTYRPLWLGLGAFASDLMIAIVVTSMLRRRIGHRTWRAVHWFAYLCWPIAVMHSVGTGTDIKESWMLALTAICVLAVVAAVWARIGFGWPERRPPRAAALFASIALPLALALWLPGGPLGAGWALRAGTPLDVLQHAAGGSGSTTAPTIVDGTVKQKQSGNGIVEVDIALSVADRKLPQLAVRIYGEPAADGGVKMDASSVSIGSPANPALYSGSITSLKGTAIEATVKSAAGKSLSLVINLSVDKAGAASGELLAVPA
jgi:DMSO/TMAO reductase YedYZ heme-binding membrane subunit